MKKIKVPLSNKGLNDLSQKINNLKNGLEQANVKIVDKLCNYGLTEIQNNFSTTGYQDGNEDVSFFKSGTETTKRIGTRGSQVLYDEFGTGTEGERNSHPIKDNYSLKGYNTGKRIRKSSDKVNQKTGIPLGIKYWTYKNKEGETVFTTGIPAGKQVFNAAISLKENKNQIIKQEVSDVLSKL